MKPWDIIGWFLISLAGALLLSGIVRFIYRGIKRYKWETKAEAWRPSIKVGDDVLRDSMGGWVRGQVTHLYPNGEVGIQTVTGNGKSWGSYPREDVFPYVEWVKSEGWAP